MGYLQFLVLKKRSVDSSLKINPRGITPVIRKHAFVYHVFRSLNGLFNHCVVLLRPAPT